ncbi:electron transport complex subunit E [Uliginosibacterium sp. 31-16]|uniref:electron transport complex subunit E n=1 Tax=Uliginosibacterium sp. 31-16 TaxID=3068315 RepID=UPI00273F6B2F|nr:electron transport complex subunit E [Uliginosibacterium sp. 31-16]MDP5238003.1 electron transport complex subunit E [Uliginosibacterium sp. 31-16]
MSCESVSAGKLFRDGLWDQNVVFAQLLAMCPTMAVTTSGTNGLGMGLATTAVLVVSNILISSIRNFVSDQVRIPIFVVVIATLVTLVDMSLNAWVHGLHKVLGLFIALIVVNCAILGRAEAFAFKNGVWASAIDGLAMGLGFTLALTVVGLVRELIGAGTLFAQASLLLGPAFSFMEMKVIPNYAGVLMMILPPGGFLVLGLLLAVKRWVDQRLAKRGRAAPEAAAHCSV